MEKGESAGVSEESPSFLNAFNLKNYVPSPEVRAFFCVSSMFAELSQRSPVWFRDGEITPEMRERDEVVHLESQAYLHKVLIPNYFEKCAQGGIPYEVSLSVLIRSARLPENFKFSKDIASKFSDN
jgi:hypothetical protein